MSREVLGSALEDVDPGGPAQDQGRDPVSGRSPAQSRAAVRLDDKPGPGRVGGADPVGSDGPDPSLTALTNARTWAVGRLDDLRGSRQRTAAALVAVALVSGLVAVGVTERARQAGQERAASVVAWLDYSSSDVDARGQAVLRLNVVNTGDDRVTVTGADLEGGLEGRPSGVGLDLDDDLTVEPQGYGSGTVAATVGECGGPVARGGSRDGDLRVTLSGADLRDTVLDGARVGAFPVTSSSVVEMACGAGVMPIVIVQGTTVRADGRLYVTLRGSRDDLEVSFTAPDGVTLVTDPVSPSPVPGGLDAPMTTVRVELVVDTCTVSAQQLSAGYQIALEIDGDRYELLDYEVVNAWVAREVARACG